MLSHRFSADPEIVSRFVAGARAVNQIRHCHIIDIFAFGQLPDGRHYYVMEYLEGETLQALLEREHRIPLARCFPILRAIGRALDAAHAKLLDFGIAKLIHPEDGLAGSARHRARAGTGSGRAGGTATAAAAGGARPGGAGAAAGAPRAAVSARRLQAATRAGGAGNDAAAGRAAAAVGARAGR